MKITLIIVAVILSTGATTINVSVCRHFYDDGVCTEKCPPLQLYNSTINSWEPNPNGKYVYDKTCVKNCPDHLLKDSGACVNSCPVSKKAVNGECVPCNGPCRKTCTGDVLIHAENIDSFEGCTKIDGYIHILDNSFDGYQSVFPNYTYGPRIPAMHPDRLEVLLPLKEITGFINIQANHSDFKNLSFFRNLEVIGGRPLYENSSALFIAKTSLESLELKSLKKINYGTITILENANLCYAENINWTRIRGEDTKHNVQSNKPSADCTAEGLVCHHECTSDGCWGAGPDQCLFCANYRAASNARLGRLMFNKPCILYRVSCRIFE